MSAPTLDDLCVSLILSYLRARSDREAFAVAASCIADVVPQAEGVQALTAGCSLEAAVEAKYGALLAKPAPVAAAAGVAAGATSASHEFADDPKFAAFLTAVKAKGFFGEAVEGTPAYEERMNKVLDTYRKKMGSDAAAASTPTTAPAAAAPPSAEDEAAAEELKEAGNAHLRVGRFAEAVTAYTDALRRCPASKNAYIYFANRAAARTSLKEFDAAVADATESTRLNASYSKGWSRLGAALQSSGKLSEAAAAYERVLALEPTNAAASDNLRTVRAALRSAAAAGTSSSSSSTPSSSPVAASAPSATSRPAAAAPGGFPGGFPGGLPGGLDGLLNNPMLSSLMSNPAVMQMAQNVMSNPGMMQNMMNMMGGLGGAGGNPFAGMGGGGAPGGSDHDAEHLDDADPAQQ